MRIAVRSPWLLSLAAVVVRPAGVLAADPPARSQDESTLQTAEPAPAERAPGRDAAEASAEPAELADSTESKASAWFEEGRALVRAEDYAAACERFEQSLQILEGVGTKFHLADCYEKIGKFAEAHRLFLEVADTTRQAGQQDRYELALARARALEPELSILVVRVEAESSALMLEPGSRELTPDNGEVQIFVDPGEYELVATAPGKVAWRKKIEAKQHRVATVIVPQLEDPEVEDSSEESSETGVNDEPVQEADSGQSGMSWIVPVAFGVGAVGLFTGLAFTQQYRSSNQDAQDVCPSSYACTPEEIDRHDELVDDARTARTRAFIGYGVAALGLAGGLAYYLSRPGEPTEQAKLGGLQIAPEVGANHWGGALYGSF